MLFWIKLLASVAVILLSVEIGRKFPSLGGLITTMPLTTLIVMLWIYSEKPDYQVMKSYTLGVMWGFVPTLMFYLMAYYCFNRKLALPLVLGASFGVWLVGAIVHQLFLK